MKTMKINVASFFWILGFFLISINCNSQDINLSRQEKKELRKAQMNANFIILDSLLNAKSFVLEADFLQNTYGDRISVVSNLNFVKVDKSKGVLQTGSDFRVGYNGVGGVTAQGTVGGWKLSKNLKSLSYSLRFNLLTNIGDYDIFMTVTSDNHATATITGSGPGRLTWEGHLKTVNNSGVFKGLETI
jgi:Domain of unknown function (DUF4251)